MRHLSWWLAGTLALVALGCSGNADSPLAPTSLLSGSPDLPGPVASALGAPAMESGNIQSALALYTIEVDAVSLTATASLKEARTGQANDDIYALAIDNFFNASSLRVVGVDATASTIDLTYRVTHPFPAPSDPAAAPNGSTNRSDLAVSGMVLALAEVASAAGNTYFADRVANTALIANADGYFSPEGLISFAGTANTFPYRLLVDESGPDGARVGVSNGGDPTGNYGTDGWTRAEYGLGNAAWTGYGVLHQGQAADNILSLDRDAIAAAGSFSFDTAVIAKYNDPRGGGNAVAKRGNRLPPASPDHALFAYRMPHGALDVQRIEFLGEGGGFVQDTISGSELRFRVEDWDARATETAAADLADDPVVTNVEVGESGLPTLAVCIPGVLGDATTTIDLTLGPVDDDTGYGGDAGQDSGIPGDGLFYAETVTKTVISGQTPGDYTGFLRVSDVNVAAPFWIPLDEGTPPLPLGANLPVPEAYQAFTVTLAPNNILPTGNWSITTTPILDGSTTTITLTNVVDPDSATFNVEVDWGDGNGFVTAATGLTPGAGPFVTGASPVYTLSNPSIAEMRTLDARLVDGDTLGIAPATNVGGTTLTINPIPAGGTGWARRAGSTLAEISYSVGTSGTDVLFYGQFANTVDFGGGNRTSAGSTDLFLVKYDQAGNYLWDWTGGSTTIDYPYGVDADGAGNVYLATYTSGSPNYGGGALTTVGGTDTYIIKLNSSGVWQWNTQVGGTLTEIVYCLEADAAGNVIAGGYYTSDPLTIGSDSSISNGNAGWMAYFNTSGTPVWAKFFNGSAILSDYTYDVAFDPSGAAYAAVQIWDTSGTGVDFGGGARLCNGTGGDVFLVKYSAAGTYAWDSHFYGSSFEYVYGIAAGSSVCAATGYWSGTMDFGGGIRTTAGNDAYVVAVNPANGAYLWDRLFSSTGSDTGRDVVVDASNNVYAVGYGSTNIEFGGGPRASTGGSDAYVVKLNSAGAYQWDHFFGSTGAELGYGAALDAAGNVVASGSFNLTADFEPGAGVTNLTSAGSTDPWVIKILPNGTW